MSSSKLFLAMDMDGTLTPSREKISTKNLEILIEVLKKFNIAIISGASSEQMDKQIPFNKIFKDSDNLCNLYKLSVNGNLAESKDGVLWERTLSITDKISIYLYLTKICNALDIDIDDDKVEDRKYQISFSFIGHNADKQLKNSFDKDGEYRRFVLQKFPFDSSKVDVRIGGTTCFDFFPKGYNKATNLISLFGTEDFIYIGDQLHPGGNDSDLLHTKCKIYTTSNDIETHRILMGLLHDKC